jgi:hypothetical protein
MQAATVKLAVQERREPDHRRAHPTPGRPDHRVLAVGAVFQVAALDLGSRAAELGGNRAGGRNHAAVQKKDLDFLERERAPPDLARSPDPPVTFRCRPTS